MMFTFPVYITMDAKTKEDAEKQIELTLKYGQLFYKLSYTISKPINDPSIPIHYGAKRE